VAGTESVCSIGPGSLKKLQVFDHKLFWQDGRKPKKTPPAISNSD
jgi:hypothetical protein